jgi:pilus assembly protein FimV
MVRHGFFLASFAAMVCAAACAPEPQKKPGSPMNIQTAGKDGGVTGAAGASGAAGAPATAGAAGTGAATGLAGHGGGAGTGAAGDPGAAGMGAAGAAGTNAAGAGVAGMGAAGAGAAGTGAAGSNGAPDASTDAGVVDANAGEVAPPVNPCARASWRFTPSIVCTCPGSPVSQKDPANAIDGNPDTRYTTGISQGSQGTETATLMFPAPVTLSGITLVSRGGDGPQIYRVDWSTDGTTFWTFEPAVTGLGSDNLTIPFPAPKKIRGVRVTQLGVKPTNWWSVHEIGVTGCMP